MLKVRGVPVKRAAGLSVARALIDARNLLARPLSKQYRRVAQSQLPSRSEYAIVEVGGIPNFEGRAETMEIVVRHAASRQTVK